jgi:hypothetical protein
MTLDQIAAKLAGLGLPGIFLVILTVSSAGSNAAIVAAITSIGGPFGILGGIGILGLITVAGDAVSSYGIEAILKAIYTERSKKDSKRSLLKEIKDLPISDELKLKLTNQLNPEGSTDSETSREPRTVEIVEE